MQTFTPGWNDPPPSLRSDQSGSSSSSTGVRNLLTKRVAFPISCTDSTTTQGNVSVPATIPPAIPPVPPIMAPVPFPSSTMTSDQSLGQLQISQSDPSQTASNVSTEVSAVESIVQLTNEEILGILRSALEARTTVPPATVDNISKRLHKLQAALEQSSLSQPCKHKLDNLVSAMKEGRLSDAYNIHSTMMVDHFAEVNQWMVGVKALILECQKNGQ